MTPHLAIIVHSDIITWATIDSHRFHRRMDENDPLWKYRAVKISPKKKNIIHLMFDENVSVWQIISSWCNESDTVLLLYDAPKHTARTIPKSCEVSEKSPTSVKGASTNTSSFLTAATDSYQFFSVHGSSHNPHLGDVMRLAEFFSGKKICPFF